MAVRSLRLRRSRAGYQGAHVSQALRCSGQTITQVSDEGVTVTLSDRNSYAVSIYMMRAEASGWSTGDSLVLCRSGAAASITIKAIATKKSRRCENKNVVSEGRL
jgi:hypothetical protein